MGQISVFSNEKDADCSKKTQADPKTEGKGPLSPMNITLPAAKTWEARDS